MNRMKVVSSSNMAPRKKRHLQDYFDNPNNILTPNQRSLPKYKNMFKNPSKKSHKNEQKHAKRLSQGKTVIHHKK